jgi:hypothetical protein
LLLGTITLLLPGCEMINPSEEVPAYLHIDSFTLVGNRDTVGTLSSNISDAWVWIDNDYMGTYELPVTFPVLKKGFHRVVLKAGIKENGIAATRLWYPFYKYYAADYLFSEKTIDTIRPVIKYLDEGYTIRLNENFESTDILFDKTVVSNIEIKKTNNPSLVCEGKYSLAVKLTKNGDLFEIESSKQYDLPRAKAIFLELNFKTNIGLKVGYYAINTGETVQHLVMTLNPTDKWKKIYVNLGTDIDQEATQNYIKLFFGALKNTDGDTSIIYMDNIKLLYFN